MPVSYGDLLAVMKRIADPDDECHCGAGGPWQDLAQIVLFGRATMDGGEWYGDDGRRLTVDEMMQKHGNDPKVLADDHRLTLG